MASGTGANVVPCLRAEREAAALRLPAVRQARADAPRDAGVAPHVQALRGDRGAARRNAIYACLLAGVKRLS